MHRSGSGGQRVPRREFVRRAALVTAVAGASTSIIARAMARSVAPTVTGAAEELGPVSGLARLRGATIAVGGGDGPPRVWGTTGVGTWVRLTDDDAFPPGTSLADVDEAGDRLLAVGSIASAQGPAPAAFASSDGESWSALSLPVKVPDLGTATSVAAGGGRFLVVGTGFEARDVLEPAGSFGIEVGLDGASSWAGNGFPNLRHGAITMVGALDDGFLLGATDVEGMRLATASGPAGPWASIRPPAIDGPAAPVAAATVDGATVLAVVDGTDLTSWWRRGSRGWSPIPPIGNMSTDVRVQALVGGRTIAVGGVAGHRGVYEEVAA
jgi:hypothetical protein